MSQMCAGTFSKLNFTAALCRHTWSSVGTYRRRGKVVEWFSQVRETPRNTLSNAERRFGQFCTCGRPLPEFCFLHCIEPFGYVGRARGSWLLRTPTQWLKKKQLQRAVLVAVIFPGPACASNGGFGLLKFACYEFLMVVGMPT